MALQITSLVNENFVGEVSGIDLREPLDDATRDKIVRAADRYGVLLFRNQPLSQEELVAFGERFGPLNVGLQQKIMSKVQSRFKFDAISDISNIDAQTGQVAAREHAMAIMNIGNSYWHSDSSYDHYPFRYSFLLGVSVVSHGGATEFADLRAAYDALDERDKRFIADKIATFYSHNVRIKLGFQDTVEDRTTYPPVQWPMVRTHPGSGRKLLWCDTKVCAISGMTTIEARAFVDEMVEHIAQPGRVYSHFWTPGDLLMYDNRAVLHRGRRFDLSERREMRRIATVDDVHSLGESGFEKAAA